MITAWQAHANLSIISESANNCEGQEASALLYSLIETAKANKLEPYAYLRHIFDRLPTASSLEDYDALLPWNVNLGQDRSVSVA
jgi:hypothetical protein